VYISPELKSEIGEVGLEEHIHIIVKAVRLERDYIAKAMAKPLHSVRQEIRLVNAFSMALPAGEVEKFAEEPWVERLELDKKVYATLDTAIPLIGVPHVWESGFTGKGVNIAIVDTGVDKNHPDLAGRVVATRDFTLEGFRDLNGHGSHVAGICAGSGEASRGKYKGLAPSASILVAKALKGDGSGRMSDVMAGIEWAVEMGAHIVNLSLGTKGPCDGRDALSELCDVVVGQGVIVCVAAGNDGPAKRTIGSPGCARKVITVGASTDFDTVAEFSSCGPTADERLKPDVLAPGVDIVSSLAEGVSVGKPVDSYYTSATGTSMAAAHVGGLAALLLEAKPGASPLLVKEALIRAAKDFGIDHYAEGAGRIVAEEALRYVQIHENPPEVPEAEQPPPGCLAGLFHVGDQWLRKLEGRLRRLPEKES